MMLDKRQDSNTDLALMTDAQLKAAAATKLINNRSYEMNLNNRKAFLDTIALSEIGIDLLKKSDNGYDVIVGATAKHLHLFSPYSSHPRIVVDLGKGLKSTAAGRYQILARYYDWYKAQLKLPDFGKASQDKIAYQMISECNALHLLDAGDFVGAVNACSSRWASLPGANYGQHENKLADLQLAYVEAGGSFVT